ncbi:uncharacterized protein LOC144633736 [Oculina patagonica]
MKTACNLCPTMFVFALMSAFAVVTLCQSCGTKAYGGSPPVLFYATKPEEPSHPQDMKRFFKAVAVRSGSSVTLTCTAMEPQGFPLSSFGSYLQPYMINWFVNSSMIRVSNCDDKPHKMKTCSLTLVNIKPLDNGRYYCQAANGLGCTYKQLQLTVTDGGRPHEKIGRHENVINKFNLAD